MAQALMVDSKIRLSFETGLNDKGEPVYKSKTIGNVKKAASADQIHETAQALASLCNDPLVTVVRNDSFDIVG
ncbi:DUF1659 domain-containing protein [Cytobacillus praedii]|uniref:DUF1659 domain-containing protein n=1 Tax=Cytobacillus praedii TaxID=1742358 RepID=A0A4R1APA4_9BACI|nr:DUF1659 domain-containing protein [Cytobacillus praedii]MED3552041.1 DUF1659 domain-containing protein [Cytobacillus praedii]MED3573269.1 DUF1659 domain-containing protein [Cytobacillus praedii]TCJ01227.1 DUF1659 domain-containing protein [Cytobacillus praedii]